MSVSNDSVSETSQHGAHAAQSAQVPQNDPIRTSIRKAVHDVHGSKPLAQSFTNFVTVNLVANAQLAVGGAAAMSYLYSDIVATAKVSNASYINVGTLLPYYGDELAHIAKAFHNMGHRWVLDPVAAGLGDLRTDILEGFRDVPPTVVRGNASEIITLSHMWGLNGGEATPDASACAAGSKDIVDGSESHGLGVEAGDEVEAATASARSIAKFLADSNPGGKAAVAVSGEVDLVTDGDRIFHLPGGSALMTRITGAGCSLGGVTATYLAVSDPLTAALAATALYNRASEKAERRSNGPGTFQPEFLDALAGTTAHEVAASPILEEVE